MRCPNMLRLILCMIAVMMLLPLFYQTVSSEQENPVEIIISLDRSSQTAQVAPGQQGLVTFDGSVWYNSFSSGSLLVNITVELEADAGGWALSITPSIIHLSADTYSGTFSLHIMVPVGTSISEERDVKVSGHFHFIDSDDDMDSDDEYTIEPEYAKIDIQQYYIYSVNCLSNYQTCSGTKPIQYVISIENRGNGDDVILIKEGSGFDILQKDDFSYSFSLTNVPINEHRAKNVTLTIAPPNDYKPWKTYHIVLNITSFKSLSSGEKPVGTHYTLTMRTQSVGFSGNINWLFVSGISIIVAIVFLIAGIIIGRISARKKKKGNKK